jgi:hypothetical protein
MSNDPKPPFVPNKATCDLLRGLAVRFKDAGETCPAWRHRYVRRLDQPAEKDWLSLKLCMDDALAASMAKDPRAERKLGWYRFQDLVYETLPLLPGSLRGREGDDAEDRWYAIVYDRLAGTSLVREWLV